MNIKTAVRISLTAPRRAAGVGSGNRSDNVVADALNDLCEGVSEIERHARQSDPRNAALFAKLTQLKLELQAAAQSAEAGRARLAAATRGAPTRGSRGPSSPGSPF